MTDPRTRVKARFLSADKDVDGGHLVVEKELGLRTRIEHEQQFLYAPARLDRMKHPQFAADFVP
ncbi:hypothetical protein [Roseobacter fucihabitans]|uniref:hypothetical protein n=1 Tax=Roseobacter fucihabitans TaxID=1537242 RepID=UPI001652BE7E|nr:hypothetical protein [Roseobacter litoralis]